MSSDQWSRAKRLLNALLETEPVDPEAWLTEQCGDPALRAEVKSLYAAHEKDFLKGGAPGEWLGDASERGGDRSPIVDRPDAGMQIGEYRLLEEVGLGGMSVVYRAERVGADFEQTVAVKLLQRRLLVENAEQRFRAERQVLASLDHPSIARLIDGGVTEGGRPYLVMEYVDGTPITEYADQNGIGLEGRLDLLGQVLDAVQAAHRQLVVHRDLKPANVLVTETKDGPRVKLLDFGIAKLLDDSLPVTRPETRTGHHLMTPTYAAPEQITGADVTTATDVYQVGALAYELLAGRRPFNIENKSATEIERLITEEEPPRPSDRAEGSPISPGDLRGDLDQILKKALRKEPERRYQSMEAMEADLERYRAGHPVEARPATFGYRAKKYAQRHRWGIGVAMAFLLMIAISGAILVRQRNRAQIEAEKSEQVMTFLLDLFEAGSPGETHGDTILVREILDRGVTKAQRFDGPPAVKGQMLNTLGRVYRELGRYEQATPLLEQGLGLRKSASGSSRREVAGSLNELALSQQKLGNFEIADSLHRRALKMRKQLFEGSHPEIATSLNNVGLALAARGKYEAADSMYREALHMKRNVYPSPNLSLAATLSNRASTLRHLGKYEKAEELQRQALTIKKKHLDGNHPDIVVGLSDLATILNEQGEYEGADSLYREALAMNRDLYDGPHPATAQLLNNLGMLYGPRGRYEKAAPFFRRALSMRRELLGDDHPNVAESLNNLARLHMAKGNYDGARPLLREALAIDREHRGANHPYVAIDRHNLGLIAKHENAYEKAGRHFQKALGIFEKALPSNHRRVAESVAELAMVRMAQGNPSEAVAMLRRALRIRKKSFPEGHRKIAETRSLLGVWLVEQGKYAAAEPLLKSSYETLKAQQGPSGESSRAAANRLVHLYKAWDKPSKAQQYASAGVDRTSRE